MIRTTKQLIAVAIIAILGVYCSQAKADIIVNISNNGSGGVDISWSGQVDSVAGLNFVRLNNYSNNQIGNFGSLGHYFFVGRAAQGRTYDGYSGSFDPLTFTANPSADNSLSSDPGVGYFNNEITLPSQYVLGTSFDGTVTIDNVQITTTSSSVVTWDNGNEFFQVNSNSGVPEPTSPLITGAMIGLIATRRRRS